MSIDTASRMANQLCPAVSKKITPVHAGLWWHVALIRAYRATLPIGPLRSPSFGGPAGGRATAAEWNGEMDRGRAGGGRARVRGLILLADAGF